MDSWLQQGIHPARDQPQRDGRRARITTIQLREIFMKLRSIAAATLSLALLEDPVAAFADPVQTVVEPTSDGSLYLCAGCNTVSDGDYVLASGYIHGDVKFSMASLQGPQSQVLFTLNPYGEPLWGKDVAIYGFASSIAALDASDATAGTYLGTLVLPDNLGYGQDASFDVTAFVNGVHSPYVGFDLRTTNVDVFSSLEYNYGHPSELLATAGPAAAVPEPANASLMLAGMLGPLGLAMRRRGD